MKITRSSRLSFKFVNQQKLDMLNRVLTEYASVVNFFINHFWNSTTPKKSELLKPIVNLPTTWMSARLRKVAAREAIDMINASRKRWGNKAVIPTHRGTRMCVSSTIAELKIPKTASEFDAWLHLHSIGNRVVIDLPVRFHKHYNKLALLGKRLESYIINEKGVQLCFEIETGQKRTSGRQIGIDTGINALASTSDGKQYGTDVKQSIERIKQIGRAHV